MEREQKNINLLRTSICIIIFVLFNFLIVSNVAAKPIKLIFSTHDVKGGSWEEIYKPFFDEITKRTNGNIIIEDHWGGELAGFFESYDAAASGIVDMVHTLPTSYPKRFPMEDIASFTSFNVKRYATSQLFSELYKRMPEMQAAYKKTKVLFKTATFPNFFALIKGRKIHTFADAKGKKFITVGRWDTAIQKAIGMVPTTIGPTETFMSFQTGVVDGGVFTFPSLYDFRIAEVLPNITLNNSRPAGWACVINLKTWNKIPKEYQKIIEEISDEIPAKQDKAQLRLFRDVQAKMKKDFPNTEIYELPRQELIKFDNAVKPVRDQFEKELNDQGLPGAKLIKIFLELETKYSSKKYDL